MALTGCEPEVRVIRDGFAHLRELSDPKPPANQALANPAAHGSWSIEVERFSGRDRQRKSLELIRRLKANTTLSDLWIEDIRGVANVQCGRFHDPADADAQAALLSVQSVQLDGAKPYGDAEFIPLRGKGRIILDPFNLKQHVGLFSLQIGFYDQNFAGDFRKAAEDRARALRAGGDKAYYYHGPFRSMVTIGIFTRDDFVTQDDRIGFGIEGYGPQIKALQERFPRNLENGQPLMDTLDGREIGEQPSFIVRVF